MSTNRNFLRASIFALVLIIFMSLGMLSQNLFYTQAQDGDLDPTIQAGLTEVARTIAAGGDPGGIQATVRAAVTATAIAASSQRISESNMDDVVELSVFNEHSFGITSIAFHPNGLWVLSSSFGTTPILWNRETGEILLRLEGHTGGVNSVAISPDGKTALTGSVDHFVILWDLQTGEIIHRMLGHSEWVYSVAYSPDGKQALSGSVDETVILWDLESGEPVRSYRGHSDTVYSVAFSPDGTLGASGSCGGYSAADVGGACDTGEIFLWDLRSGEMVTALSGHAGIVYSLDFSQDGRHLLSGSSDHSLILWDVAEGTIVHRYPDCDECDGHTDSIRSVSLSSDGQLALSGSEDGSAIIWDVETARILRRFEFRDRIRAVNFGPLNEVFAVGSRNHVIRIFGLP